MHCPSCIQDEKFYVEVPCLDENGEKMVFPVCQHCDYGINDHTEGECDCEKS